MGERREEERQDALGERRMSGMLRGMLGDR